MIARLRKTRDASLEAIVSAARREGLKQLEALRCRKVRFRADSANLGRCLLGKVDTLSEAPAMAEGDIVRFADLRWQNPLAEPAL